MIEKWYEELESELYELFIYPLLVCFCFALNSVKDEIYIKFSRGLIQHDIQRLPTGVASRRQQILEKKNMFKIKLYIIVWVVLLAAVRVNVIWGIHSGYRTGGQRRSL